LRFGKSFYQRGFELFEKCEEIKRAMNKFIALDECLLMVVFAEAVDK
jgi:hypothetical protein